jgi:murein DD-endopeptidase MepM/ murein hydrolase activator NlpD
MAEGERQRAGGWGSQGEGDAGSIGLLVLTGGGLAMLVALVLLVTIADLVISRGQAQLAADAAALAAMSEVLHPGSPLAAPARSVGQRHPPGADAAAVLAESNGGEVVECCGDDPSRREVVVAVAPRSALLRSVLPRVRARAAAALEAAGAPVDVEGALGVVPGTALGAGPGGTPAADGARLWPVEGSVTSGFGPRVHPLTGQQRLHAGLDVAAAAGTPIRAAAAGQIIAATTLGGYGLAVDIRHGDGTVTRYAHQSRLLVRPGQQVAAGQVIGLVGSTGASTGPHLHFEVQVGGGPIDPLSWLPPQ